MEDAGVRSGLLSLVVCPTFLADPPRVVRNRGLMAAKITMTLKGEMRRKFHGGFHGDDSRQCPRSRKSRFMRVSFATRVNEFPLLTLCLLGESSFLSDRRRNAGGKMTL